jgi:hypothetical protein
MRLLVLLKVYSIKAWRPSPAERGARARQAQRREAAPVLDPGLLGKYNAFVAPRKRLTYTLTADPDVMKRADGILKLLGVSRSYFVEAQMVNLIHWAEPLAPILEALKSGDADPGEVKALLRRQMPEIQELLSSAHGDVADLMRYSVNTEKE